ncbi:RNA polymerase sigma factor [Paenibacillus sp. WST5]|uniref:RNA polymerase sigma factor n=1 Tax=Paenibacillus sedimenti TaxID=2770274 RepID=A0A926KJ66_9BACL|nr:RNA polymerase sigma factor [Paenibacillus sedimenti]
MTDRELFETYRKDIYLLCYYMLQHVSDAEDICQETFVKAFQIDRCTIEKMKPWLIRIAVNLCKNQLERSKRGKLKELKLFLLQTMHLSEPAETVFERIEGDRQLERWLQALPVKIRAVMTLRYINDLPLAEVAEVLDIPLGTVKSRLNKGLQLAKKHLNTETKMVMKGGECLE